MGWFWDSNTTTNKSSSTDAYSKLDPALRDFLDKESPVKYADTAPKQPPKPARPQQPPQDQADTTYRSKLSLDTPGLSQTKQNSPAASQNAALAAPPESLFPDGRYAHLWATYRPYSEIESAGKSDQDRMKDVFDAYTERRAAIGRAAIENCVMEQIAEKECFTKGPWSKRMNMCREENRAFNRCYEMQARFLKALGYLSAPRSGGEEERIQMHADKLYQEMLAREAQADAARKEGLETPALPQLIRAEETTKALGEESAWARIRKEAAERGQGADLSSYAPDKQKAIKERVKDMNPTERELELQLIAAESRAQLEYADQIRGAMEEERMNRAGRRDRGRETFGDTMKRLWGWDK